MGLNGGNCGTRGGYGLVGCNVLHMMSMGILAGNFGALKL
jgi:hypothetical protein